MAPSPTPPDTPGFMDLLKGDAGLGGRLALSWALAGGLSMEVVLVVATSLSSTPHAPTLPFTASLFFAAGAVGGFAHGALVGVAGRPDGVTLTQSCRGIEAAALWAVPTLALGWVAALWISMTPLALSLLRPWAVVTGALGWAICVAACLWALGEARLGMRFAMQRWPERRPGTPLMIATFVVLLASFLWRRPEIWFTDLRVSALGAVVLAVGATVWIALPVVVFILHFLHRWSGDSRVWETGDAPTSS